MLGAGNIGLGDQLWCRSAPPTSIVAEILEGRVVTHLAEACARARAASCTVVWPTMTPAYSTAAGYFVASLLGATTAKHCRCRYRRSGRYSAKLCLPSPGREVFDWAWPPMTPWVVPKRANADFDHWRPEARLVDPSEANIQLIDSVGPFDVPGLVKNANTSAARRFSVLPNRLNSIKPAGSPADKTSMTACKSFLPSLRSSAR